ncbi:hypothetical protein AHAS_Ahas15G0099900 [Arachis hypogaea]
MVLNVSADQACSGTPKHSSHTLLVSLRSDSSHLHMLLKLSALLLLTHFCCVRLGHYLLTLQPESRRVLVNICSRGSLDSIRIRLPSVFSFPYKNNFTPQSHAIHFPYSLQSSSLRSVTVQVGIQLRPRIQAISTTSNVVVAAHMETEAITEHLFGEEAKGSDWSDGKCGHGDDRAEEEGDGNDNDGS